LVVKECRTDTKYPFGLFFIVGGVTFGANSIEVLEAGS